LLFRERMSNRSERQQEIFLVFRPSLNRVTKEWLLAQTSFLDLVPPLGVMPGGNIKFNIIGQNQLENTWNALSDVIAADTIGPEKCIESI
jgi:hypothetical protein